MSTLLRHSFAIPKMVHILHTSPSFVSPHPQDYDNLLRLILGKISNSNFENNDTFYSCRPLLAINMGGLGIQSGVYLASSAFLASADGSLKLVYNILPSRFHHTPYQEWEEPLHHWGIGRKDMLPHLLASIGRKRRICLSCREGLKFCYHLQLMPGPGLIFWSPWPRSQELGLKPCRPTPLAFDWTMKPFASP